MIYLFELIGIFFQKPMVFGYYNAIIGVVILLLTTIFAFTLNQKTIFSKMDINIFVICFILLIFNCINNFFLGSSFYSVLNDIVIGFFTLLSLVVVFSYKKPEKYKKTFSNMLFLIIIFTFISLSLVGFDVDKIDSLTIFEIPIKDRDEIDSMNILLPFTVIPWRMTVGDIILPRATFFGIEPGIGVFVIFLWRYLLFNSSKFLSYIYDIVFIFSLLITASTTMLLLLFFWFGGRYISINGLGFYFKNKVFGISIKKIVFISMSVIATVYLFLYMPYFGYLEKVTTHGESFEVRDSLYSDEKTGIFRYFRVLFLIVFYFYIRKYMDKNFFILYSAMVSVSLLNVFIATPLFFLSIFLSKRHELVDYDKSK